MDSLVELEYPSCQQPDIQKRHPANSMLLRQTRKIFPSKTVFRPRRFGKLRETTRLTLNGIQVNSHAAASQARMLTARTELVSAVFQCRKKRHPACRILPLPLTAEKNQQPGSLCSWEQLSIADRAFSGPASFAAHEFLRRLRQHPPVVRPSQQHRP